MGLGVWDFIWALDVSVRDTVLLAYRGEWLASLVCITERIGNQKSIINSNVPNNTIDITMTNPRGSLTRIVQHRANGLCLLGFGLWLGFLGRGVKVRLYTDR